jgi:hypothetical protein
VYNYTQLLVGVNMGQNILCVGDIDKIKAVDGIRIVKENINLFIDEEYLLEFVKKYNLDRDKLWIIANKRDSDELFLDAKFSIEDNYYIDDPLFRFLRANHSNCDDIFMWFSDDINGLANTDDCNYILEPVRDYSELIKAIMTKLKSDEDDEIFLWYKSSDDTSQLLEPLTKILGKELAIENINKISKSLKEDGKSFSESLSDLFKNLNDVLDNDTNFKKEKENIDDKIKKIVLNMLENNIVISEIAYLVDLDEDYITKILQNIL